MNQDQDLVMILLELEKGMVKNYATAVTETSNETLTESYMSLLNASKDAWRNLFDIAINNGWYQVEYAELQKISQEDQKLTNKFNSINGSTNE